MDDWVQSFILLESHSGKEILSFEPDRVGEALIERSWPDRTILGVRYHHVALCALALGFIGCQQVKPQHGAHMTRREGSISLGEAMLEMAQRLSRVESEKPIPASARKDLAIIANNVNWATTKEIEWKEFSAFSDDVDRTHGWNRFRSYVYWASVMLTFALWDCHLHRGQFVWHILGMLPRHTAELDVSKRARAWTGDDSNYQKHWPWRNTEHGFELADTTLEQTAGNIFSGDPLRDYYQMWETNAVTGRDR